MDLIEFQNSVRKAEQILENTTECETNWIEPYWFHIEPKNKEHSSISIRYEFNEVRVGIDAVDECFSDKFEEGRTHSDGINRFKEVLRSRIKRQKYYKGSFHFRTDYFVERNGTFESFATMLLWAFPFWKKTRIDEFIQNPILTNP